MAVTDADDSDGGIAERAVDVLVERILPFSWAGGFLAGVGAFVAGFLGIGGYLVYRGALAGSVTEKLITVGHIFYNSQMVPIVWGSVDMINPRPNPVAGAGIPGIYYAIPVIAIVGASIVFTYARRPDEQSAGYAVLTAFSMTIGYLLLALLGTFVFTQPQVIEPPTGGELTAIVRPDRLGTLTYGLLYPLVVGLIGSIPAQAALVNDNAENE
ncbi:hypothetical protein [Halorientalis salina]|uniref:hypothetical protein n=1 Tax=Halorientalis salina TaxID=2932266 RepID=UPI0010ABC904|nr:hypothetical protein [Halorientalis salina]